MIKPQVHHSSEEFNLTTAFRQPFFQGLFQLTHWLSSASYIFTMSSSQRWIFLLSWRCAPPTDIVFFVQKYSIWSVSCRNIHIMVYCAKILVRYRYMLHENEANQWITCRFSEFLIKLCKKKTLFWGVRAEMSLFLGFVQKYYCPELLHLWSLVQGLF